MFALALRTRTYRGECGGILPLSSVRNADLLCPAEQGRGFAAARVAFVRWILVQAAEYKLDIGYGATEVPVAPYSSDEDEDCAKSDEERYYGPPWVPTRYQAVFCQLVQFASGVVATHIRLNERPNRPSIPLSLLIERLSFDFGQFFGHRAEDHIRHQLNQLEGRLARNPDDKKFRHFMQRTMIAYRDPIVTWDPPPFEAGTDTGGPPCPAPWDSPPTAYLDGLRSRQHDQDGRCFFDMARWYAWRDVRESLLPVLRTKTKARGFMARQEVIYLYDR